MLDQLRSESRLFIPNPTSVGEVRGVTSGGEVQKIADDKSRYFTPAGAVQAKILTCTPCDAICRALCTALGLSPAQLLGKDIDESVSQAKVAGFDFIYQAIRVIAEDTKTVH